MTSEDVLGVLGRVDTLVRERDTHRDTVARLRAVLRQLEWPDTDYWRDARCLVCGALRSAGHAPSCAVRDALEEG